MTKLSPHFSLEELTFSEKALRLGLDNTPAQEHIDNLRRLCLIVLEPAREILGVPIHINSGYRSQVVNEAVGSTAMHSQHLDGCAADWVPIGIPLRTAFAVLRAELRGWDQMILECNAWIHVSIPRLGLTARGEAKLATGVPGHWIYTALA
jgi:zinc D-Ala-D-Ala carboxypeptidase